MAKTATAQLAQEGTITGRIRSLPERIKSFYVDVRTEMKKVTTPARKEVSATTIVVVITVFLFGAYFWIIDNVIGYGIDQVLRHFKR